MHGLRDVSLSKEVTGYGGMASQNQKRSLALCFSCFFFVSMGGVLLVKSFRQSPFFLSPIVHELFGELSRFFPLGSCPMFHVLFFYPLLSTASSSLSSPRLSLFFIFPFLSVLSSHPSLRPDSSRTSHGLHGWW